MSAIFSSASCFLAFISVSALIFKVISDESFANRGKSDYLDYVGPESPESYQVSLSWFSKVSYSSDEIVWASIGLGWATAAVSLWISVRARSKGPLHWARVHRLCLYTFYYITPILPLATFIFLTYNHAQSAHFHEATTFTEINGEKTCVGLCTGRTYGGFKFDRETWTCDLYRAPEVLDPANMTLKICVCETATRWSLLVLGLAMVAAAGLLEWDRRRGRSLVESWRVRAREECEVEGVEDTYNILLK